MGKYRVLIDVPIGTEMIVKKTGDSVLLEEIRFYPTRYRCSDGNYYKTHEVDILWEDTDDEN
tara:strand:+ start:126 stop:311 length:186 start_codon:yes stop_codon:yes gene_type:complete